MRHKAFALARETVDEATFDMEMLDYAFHLFVETGSGVDTVLYRTDDGLGHRLAQVEPRPDDVIVGTTAVTMSPQPAPHLELDGAVARLDRSGFPFVFFADVVTGRGCVIYHRYDGHLGLLTPAE